MKTATTRIVITPIPRRRAWLAFICGLIPWLLPAQIVTDGTAGAARTLTGPAFAIPDSLGTIRGPNLFHSFMTFNLHAGESATFSGPNSIANVFSRVTDGNPSTLDGALKCTIPHASFFFLNPAGVIFGPNASIDVGGSFAVTTSDYLTLADGGRFDARTPANDVLTVAHPAAFGFLNPLPGHSIAGAQFNSCQLAVPPGQTLTVAAGPITVTTEAALGALAAPAKLKASGGTLQIAAVASGGEMAVEGVDTQGFAALANIQLAQGSVLTTSGDLSGGHFLIRGNDLSLSEGASLKNQSWATATGGKSEIQLRGDLRMRDGSLLDGFAFDQSAGGDLNIQAQQVELANSKIITAALDQANAGNARITAKNLVMDQQSQISASTTGPGHGGNLSISVDKDMTLRANSAVVSGSQSTGAGGNSGNINIHANSLDLYDGSQIQANTFGNGNAGNIQAEVSSLYLEGQLTPRISTFVSSDSQPGASGKAGNVEITASQIDLKNSAYISADTQGGGLGGNVHLTTGSLSLDTQTLLSTSAYGAGDAGHLAIEANTIDMKNVSIISAGTFASGKAGTIAIHADVIRAQGHSSIASQSPDGLTGSAGNINITARAVTLEGGASISAPANSAERNAVAGNIILDVTEDLLVTGASFISTTTGPAFGGSAGGTIGIKARDVTLSNFGSITSATQSPATGGDINLLASGALVLDQGLITADVVGHAGAAGGNIEASGGQLRLLGGSTVSCGAADASAGSVTLRSAGPIEVNHGTISVHSDNGNAGTVALRSPESIVLQNSLLSAQAGKDGGNISIDPAILGLIDSRLNANAVSGNGGHISLSADFMYELGDSLITAISESQTAQPGTVTIRSGVDFANSLDVLSGGSLLAESAQLRLGCARKNPRANSLIIRGKGGIARRPDAFLPVLDFGEPIQSSMSQKPRKDE